MRALTVRQPWASLLCDPTLPKWIETRSRRTHVRGTIGIIAGLWHPADCTLDVGDYEMVAGWYTNTPHKVYWTLDGGSAEVCDLPLGALIGTVDLYDCAPIGHTHSFRTGAVDGDEGDFPGQAVVVNHGDRILEYGWQLTLDADGRVTDITDQAPYGDFTPGRWAWLTRNAVLFEEPIPMRGAQHWQQVPA